MTTEEIVELYVGGLSTVDIAGHTGLSISHVGRVVRKAGVARTRSEGRRQAIKNGKLWTKQRLAGMAKRVCLSCREDFTPEHRHQFMCKHRQCVERRRLIL